MQDETKSWRIDLSGGGVRAALAGLGAIYCLRRERPHDTISLITSVSGGTLTNLAIATSELDIQDMNNVQLDAFVWGLFKRLKRNYRTVSMPIAFLFGLIVVAAAKFDDRLLVGTNRYVFTVAAVVWLVSNLTQGHWVLPSAVIVFLSSISAIDTGPTLRFLLARGLGAISVVGIVGLLLQHWVLASYNESVGRREGVTAVLIGLVGTTAYLGITFWERFLGKSNAVFERYLLLSRVSLFLGGAVFFWFAGQRRIMRVVSLVLVFLSLPLPLIEWATRNLGPFVVPDAIVVGSYVTVWLVVTVVRGFGSVSSNSFHLRSVAAISSAAAGSWLYFGDFNSPTGMVCSVSIFAASMVYIARRLNGNPRHFKQAVFSLAPLALLTVGYGLFINSHFADIGLVVDISVAVLGGLFSYCLYFPRYFASLNANALRVNRRANLESIPGRQRTHAVSVASLRSAGPAYFIFGSDPPRLIVDRADLASSRPGLVLQSFDAGRTRIATVSAAATANIGKIMPFVPLRLNLPLGGSGLVQNLVLPPAPEANVVLQGIHPLYDGGFAGTVGIQFDRVFEMNVVNQPDTTARLVVDATSPRKSALHWPLVLLPIVNKLAMNFVTSSVALGELTEQQRVGLAQDENVVMVNINRTRLLSADTAPESVQALCNDASKMWHWWPSKESARTCLEAGYMATQAMLAQSGLVNTTSLNFPVALGEQYSIKSWRSCLLNAIHLEIVRIRELCFRVYQTLTSGLVAAYHRRGLIGVSFAMGLVGVFLLSNLSQSAPGLVGAKSVHPFFQWLDRPLAVSHEGLDTTSKDRSRPLTVERFKSALVAPGNDWRNEQDVVVLETDLVYHPGRKEVVAVHEGRTGKYAGVSGTEKRRWDEAATLRELLALRGSFLKVTDSKFRSVDTKPRWFFEFKEYNELLIQELKTQLKHESNRVCFTFGGIRDSRIVDRIRAELPGSCSCASISEKGLLSESGPVRWMTKLLPGEPSMNFNCIVVADVNADPRDIEGIACGVYVFTYPSRLADETEDSLERLYRMRFDGVFTDRVDRGNLARRRLSEDDKLALGKRHVCPSNEELPVGQPS